jgi:hypothetical protein
VYIGASNELVAQAYTPFMTVTPYSNITNFYDGSKRIKHDGAEKVSMNDFVCVWLKF